MSRGRRAVLLPAASAVLLGLSLPPLPLAFLAPFAFAPLAFHLHGLSRSTAGTRDAAIAGAVFGGVHAALLLHWLPFAALPLLGPFGAAGAGLAIWGAHAAMTAVGTAAVHRASRRGRLPFPIAFGAAWVVLGWLPAGIPFVGFPWLGPEAALVEMPWLLGSSDLVGGAGVAGILALSGGALGGFAAEPSRGSFGFAATALLVLVAAGSYGWVRSGAAAEGGDPRNDIIRVAIVGIEADPDRLSDPATRAPVLIAALREVDGLVAPNEADLVFWPESPTGSREGEPEVELALERMTVRPTPILFGALGSGQGGGTANRLVLASAGGIGGAHMVTVHEKRRLVPGVERTVPWETGGIRPGRPAPPFGISEEGAGRASDPVDDPVSTPGGDVLVGGAICFEALFAGESRRARRAGARVLFLAVNEGWLRGKGGGAFDGALAQHRAAAILLAVETRMPVVRSAVGGPAAAWNAAERPLVGSRRNAGDQGGILLVEVRPAGDGPPLAARGGADAMGWAAFLVLALGVAARRRNPGPTSRSASAAVGGRSPIRNAW